MMRNNKSANTNSRSSMLHKNILFSGVLKAIGLITSLVIVPVTINYLNDEVYGVWMTITSVLYWITTFDIGLGNGMRNYLTEALSKGDTALGRSYLSTTLILLSLIALTMGAALIYPMYSINFNSFFNFNSILLGSIAVADCYSLIF